MSTFCQNLAKHGSAGRFEILRLEQVLVWCHTFYLFLHVVVVIPLLPHLVKENRLTEETEQVSADFFIS